MCGDKSNRRGPTRRKMVGFAALTGTAGLFSATARADDPPAGRIKQLVSPTPKALIARAFAVRERAAREGDQPYGALVADAAGVIVAQAPSRVVTNGDPTAHAEMEAIRAAATALGSRSLAGHTLYSSSHPCPMCKAAAYWAGIERMVHGRDAKDAGAPGLCR